MTKSPAATVRFDPLLLSAVLALVALGLVMVYSSSAIAAQDKLGDSFYYLKRQAVASGIGLLGMAVAMAIGYRRLARLAYPLLIVSVIALALVLIPGIGSTVGGSRRWIRLAGFSFQPAELAKFSWVLYLAYSLAKKKEKVATFSIGFLPHLMMGGVLVLLCMIQPDFGSSIALLFLLFTLLFTAGAKLSYLVGSALVAIPFAYAAIARSPYRMNRILAFLDPWAHRNDVGYQVAESLMSIGSGGVNGLGLGDGRQKLFFLPEAHSDFIFSILGEELGLLGVGILVLFYSVVIWRGIRAALDASEAFGTYLAAGLTSLFAFHAIVNMCVAMGLVPTKGLTLPFVSYGGTSLVVMMGAAGVLLSITGINDASMRNRVDRGAPGQSRPPRWREAAC